MSGARPKQYRNVCGRTLLEHALQPFFAHAGIDGIVVVLAPGDADWGKLACARVARIRVAQGGEARMISVANGLEALAQEASAHDWVLVHDAARPCLRSRDLERLIAEVDDDEVGGLLALPIADTVKRSDDSGTRVGATLERAGLWAAQTPQMFRYELLRRALSHCAQTGHAATDEAAAIEALGLRARLVEGSAHNIKVTREEDLALAEAILRSDPT